MNESRSGGLTIRQLALAASLAYFILIGGTNLGTYLVPIAAFNAAVAAGLVGLWLVELPRNNDLADRLLLAALLLYLLACVTSAFPRMSFEAATSVTASIAAFGVARGELVAMRAERAMITVLALCGSVLAAGFLIAWIPQWIEWWSVTRTLPPLDLPLQPGPYRHYHIAAMLLALLLPSLLQAGLRSKVGPFAVAAVVTSLVAVYMSGSRTAWLAVAVVGAAVLIARLRIRPRLIVGMGVAVGALALLTLGGLLGSTTARLLNTFTLALRGETWASALAIWGERPITGWGPGSFAATFRFQQELPIFPDPGGHAHNVIVQALLEAGVVGLAALALVVAALAVGVSRSRRRSPYALMGLAVFGLMSLTDLPSNFPMALVIGITWAALAGPRAPSSTQGDTPRRTWFLAASGTLGAVILIAVVSTLIAWAAFDEARLRLDGGDLPAARRELDRAVAFDPSMALYWRERGTRAADAGSREEAVRDLEHAVQLNGGDATTLRALAILAVDDGELDSALRFARRAVEMRGTQLANQLTLAWVAIEAGDPITAARALAAGLTWYPWASAAPTWSGVFGGEVNEVLSRALAAWQAQDRDDSWEATWLRPMTGNGPIDDLAPSLAALEAALGCDSARAASLLEADEDGANGRAGLTARLILARVLGDEDAYRTARTVAIVRHSPLASLALRDPGPASPFSDYLQDVALYKRIPLPPAQWGLMLPTQWEGLSAWLRDPREAARRGAPGSGLAECGA